MQGLLATMTRLRRLGYPLPEGRVVFLKSVFAFRRPFSAEDVYDLLSRRGFRQGFAAVRRELELLTELAMIRRSTLADGTDGYAHTMLGSMSLFCDDCRRRVDIRLTVSTPLPHCPTCER